MKIERLTELEGLTPRRGPVVLAIMDGVAYGAHAEGDAVRSALTPTLDWLHQNCPGTRLKAHGTAVGMPSDDDMGNSEIGHNAIGCGRVFSQGAKLVSEAIAAGALFRGPVWQDLIENSLAHGSTLHFIGLVSDGNVHSHIDHLRGLIKAAVHAGVRRIRVHALLDGRDVGETSALDYIDPLEAELEALNARGADCRIASGGGRMVITMDRYGADWDMVRCGWDVHVHGRGRTFSSAHQAIVRLRQETGAIDQDLPAFVVAADGEPVGPIQDHDSVVIFNFRGDRAMELCNAFEVDDFSKFDRGRRPPVRFAGMMQYDGDLNIPRRYLVDPPGLDRTVGEFLCNEGVRQLAISETQKFGHVTYFFNGNRSCKFDEDLEEYVEIRSDNVPFDQRPAMKAAEITDRVIKSITRSDCRFIRMNFPNGDMVGHTGNFLATEIAVEVVDLCLGRLVPAVRAAGGVLIVTADHGNADDMYERDKKSGDVITADGRRKMKTCHSLNRVPCLIYDPDFNGEYGLGGNDALGITSLAATCINLLGYRAPEDYDPAVIAFP